MITAVDTNVLLDVFGADPKFGASSASALRRCLAEGTLVACEAVWAETATAFSSIEKFRHTMAGIPVAFAPMAEAASEKAAQAWHRYRLHGGSRTRIASDFLIGAHAQIAADRLLTRDRGFYRRYFSGLAVIDPSHRSAER
ncbi:MAG TPA: type II toxin-antitoxin system VapC family toxin [Candidatus Binataceae bacterium]|nr:type II toxin-antitoxin system VapC family toxin [Candidatus Binataceae bacterium]